MKRRVLRGLAKKHNTFIGGVASTVNTEALIANKYLHYPSGAAVLAEEIKNLEIVGNDIMFRVDFDYEIKSYNLGFGISGLTHYIDKEGKCRKYNANSIIYHSYNLSTIVSVELPKLEKISPTPSNWQFAFTFPVFERFYVPKVTEWGNNTGLENNATPSAMLRTAGFPFNAPNLVITTSIVNQTSNDGGVEGDLAWMIDNAGVTVNFV